MATNKRMTLLGERAPHVAADHHAIRDITGGDERRTILFLVNPHHCPGEAFFQRQTCPQAVEPINMAFLVNGKYYRLNLRIDREPNEFVNLVNELRIFGQLERRYAGGLPALGASTALNREADGPRHHDAGSTPRFEGRAFEHQSDNVLGDLVSQRADEGGPRRVGKEPVEVFYHEPLLQPPDADRRTLAGPAWDLARAVRTIRSDQGNFAPPNMFPSRIAASEQGLAAVAIPRQYCVLSSCTDGANSRAPLANGRL